MAEEKDIPYLTGQLLIAMPAMTDPRFAQSVIYVCEHSAKGAMGLVINRKLGEVTLSELLEQVENPVPGLEDPINIHFGGPIDTEKGFILHSIDTTFENSLIFDNEIALTSTLDILKHMANGEGPQKSIFVLGYASWDAKQLEGELLENVWLTAPAQPDLIFHDDNDTKWEKALAILGITPESLSSGFGHA